MKIPDFMLKTPETITPFNSFKMFGITLVRFFFKVLAGGLGINAAYNNQNDLLPSPIVHCTRWAYLPPGQGVEKFKLKHLLDAYDATIEEILAWDRATWNRNMRPLLDFNIRNTKPTYPDSRYGSENRMSVLMTKYQAFKPQYQRADPRIDPFLRTMMIKTDSKSMDHHPQQTNISWIPDPMSMMYAVWQFQKNSYDIYIMERQFVMIGHSQLQPNRRIEPIHFDGNLLARPTENNLNQLKALNNNTPGQLQERFTRADLWDLWFMQESTCIAPPKPPPFTN